jgi:hypothetical protein
MRNAGVIRLVEPQILIVRGQRVILDPDLAALYGVTVKRLNEQVKRNAARFPEDFMFRLTLEEAEFLRSQFATSRSHGGRRHLPHAFTEHGAIMAASVLNSRKAVQMSLFVVRAFVRLREMIATNRVLATKMTELESRLDTHDATILQLIQEINRLMRPTRRRRRQIGFLPEAS